MSKNKIKLTCLVIFSIAVLVISCQTSESKDYSEMIDRGEYKIAKQLIETKLLSDSTLSNEEKFILSFEIERMERIRKDFTKDEEEVLQFIRKYIPGVTGQDINKWEREKSLEFMIIDGEKKYFNRAARNLFRINKQCREIWKELHRDNEVKTEKNILDYKIHNSRIIKLVQTSGEKYVSPVRMRITYSIAVKPNKVPRGEIIRCWIPFPREIPGRQSDINLIRSEPKLHNIADNSHFQRTIYFEKESQGKEKTNFSATYEYTSKGSYTQVDPEKVRDANPDGELKIFLREEPPHIVFTSEFKNLSERILANEKNPYRKAQILFKWVNDNIPWASAREYSTIRSLSQYGLKNKHGDCGIQSMMFITLCRLNGIPARWQSGWDFTPPDDTMHDWGMIYFEPYGWMPMDAYYGPMDSENVQLKWFYLSGMDSYRLIFNDDYGQIFSPPKKHHRSETLDSQRGEVEWKGGNLYFDQWDWSINWQVLHSDMPDE